MLICEILAGRAGLARWRRVIDGGGMNGGEPSAPEWLRQQFGPLQCMGRNGRSLHCAATNYW